jgi:hypothetical protein
MYTSTISATKQYVRKRGGQKPSVFIIIFNGQGGREQPEWKKIFILAFTTKENELELFVFSYDNTSEWLPVKLFWIKFSW